MTVPIRGLVNAVTLELLLVLEMRLELTDAEVTVLLRLLLV